MKKTAILASALHWVLLAILFLFLILATSCEGKRGRAGLPGADADDGFERVFARGEALPGLNVESLRILGASLPDGSFRPGDPVQVEFKVTFDDGTEVPLEELDSFSMYVSGPTYHYQQVIQRQRDIADVAVMLADGTYRYQFPGGMPAVFAPPLNDTDDLTEGEWTGQDLVPGTYTLGLELYRFYEYGGDDVRDATNATLDFSVLGGDGSNGREVVTRENCNQCHGDLRVHGTFRLEPKLCVLCHTAGAEDGNDPDVEGGTPGRTIDFKVMIHKIHAGHSLPSVQGMTTDANGDRDYSVPGVPYKLLGFGSSVHDYSEVVWPQWPSLAAPMPRDVGYGALGSDDQSKENAVRSGPVQCAACHGDPDGDGELPAPIHGDLAFTQPTRAACGSCHDDIVWDHPYTSNLQKMPAQDDDATCKECHAASGDALAVEDAHLHPISNALLNPGIHATVDDVVDAGAGSDDDGRFDSGERVGFRLRVHDDAGDPIGSVERLEAVLSGPAQNPNLTHLINIPTSALSGDVATRMRLPEKRFHEFVGTSTGASNEIFKTSRRPHWNLSGAETVVYTETAVGASSAVADTVPAGQNWFDVTAGRWTAVPAGRRFAHRRRHAFADRIRAGAVGGRGPRLAVVPLHLELRARAALRALRGCDHRGGDADRAHRRRGLHAGRGQG